MNTFLKSLSFSCIFLATASTSFAQETETPIHNLNAPKSVYLGLGFGLDHGGMGAKIEYLPVKNIGVFAGLGYNLAELGWNLGATYKIKTSERFSINPTAFYGYNGVLKVDGASEYDMVSHGLSVGLNLDFHVGKKDNKITAGIFVPFRSQKFNDNYDLVKDHPYIKMDSKLTPVTFSIGYNWKVN